MTHLHAFFTDVLFFLDKLVGICKHWDILDPVFHNRSSSRLIAPTGTFKNAPPFVITSARENTEDGNFDLDHPDLFPFGENAFPDSEDDAKADAVNETAAGCATSTSDRSRDVDVASQSAGEATRTGSDTNAAVLAATASDRPMSSHESKDKTIVPLKLDN
ncbi:hypothetical protein PR003_g23308 [Phytophthora rubi]|uniref:AGC-kinase C-terminal domain-containing protein n=1 Tax=Phytophthora rubi TaxID=129364 RepID=A0A6A3IH33_9STRA|nr:hypothetical protein PR002_g23560 [Phytophthora rubi]KAE9298174.1 hypothetical protein PR003_g23308 [Phytophthora rubi]